MFSRLTAPREISICLLLGWTCILFYLTLAKVDRSRGIFESYAPARMELEDVSGVSQENPLLIRYLRQYHIFPPSSRHYRYSTLYGYRTMYIEDSRLTTRIIQNYLKNMTNGVFVEAGANNGADELSNTLVLERDYNWTGLLVEGSPLIFPRLIAAHRKAFKADVLLSKYPYTKLVVFEQGDNVYGGRETAPSKKAPLGEDAPVQVLAEDGKTHLYNFEVLTVPLYSLIAACDLDTIDYLSLDVEGTELEILKNFPFDKVLIRTMLVEVNLLGEQRKKELIDFLATKGYAQHPSLPTHRDIIFVHNSVLDNKTI